MPGGGKVDVSVETMTMVFNRRKDIGDLYCANLRPNGTPWCPVINGQPTPDIVPIITDWWTRVAGSSDDPGLYEYSLAKYVEKQFGIPPIAQPGDTPKLSQKVTQSVGPNPNIEGLPATTFVYGTGIFMFLMFLWGSTRKNRLSYTPTGGSAASTRMPSLRKK